MKVSEVSVSNRVIAQASPTTKALIARLERAEPGETVFWEELMGLAARDLPGTRSLLITAKKTLLNERNMVFVTERGIGLRRARDSEKVGVARGQVVSANKRARAGLRVIEAVDFEALPEGDHAQFNATTAMLGALTVMSRPAAQKKVLLAVQNAGGKLDLAHTLQLFGGPVEKGEPVG